MIDLTLIPIGIGTSLSKYVAKCQEVLKAMDLTYTLHAFGTNIEGDWDLVFEAVKRCHLAIHEEGAPRIASIIKVGTRTDKKQTLKQKINSVQDKLELPTFCDAKNPH